MELKNILSSLLEPWIPSGSEPTNNTMIKEIFKEFCDDVKDDVLGNVIGVKKGGSGNIKVMMAAHMDEIGLMVKHIDDKGFISFSFVGGVDQRILPAQRVVIHGDKDILGVIGTKPPHIQDADERRKAIKHEDMFIDTGLSVDEVKRHVKIGDYITFERTPLELANKRWSSNAQDDRAGVAVMLWALKELEKLKFSADVYAVATAQEEVGLRGAIVSSFSIYPDIGIAIDVCHANMPDVPEYDTQKLSEGPVVTLGPNIHPKLFDKFIDIAKDHNIPHQVDPAPGPTGTDAWAMQITREGIPTALISIPLRYMHTTVETLCLEDVKRCGRLIALFISSLSKEFMEELSCF